MTPTKTSTVKVQPTTPPSTSNPSRTIPPPPPTKGKGVMKSIWPLPGIRYPVLDPPRRSLRNIQRRDYAAIDRHGLELPDNDRSLAPWRRSEEAKPEIAQEEDSEKEIDASLIEEEWQEYAYSGTQQPRDEDHPTYEETLTRWDADAWSRARDEEIQSFLKHETFELTDLPSGFKPLHARWVNVIKRNANNEITRYRARLVVKGYGQRYGIDYSEVFAHVLWMDSFRILLVNAAINKWDVIGLDIKSAFLNG